MEPLSVNPAAAAIGTQVVANGVRGLAAGTAATAEVTALAPAGAEEVSAHAVLALLSASTRWPRKNSLALAPHASRPRARTRQSTPPTRPAWSDESRQPT